MRRALRRASFTAQALPRAFADPSRAPAVLQRDLGDTPVRRLETFLDCVIAGDGPPEPRAPCLILWGAADHLPGTRLNAGRKLGAAIPGARFVPLESAGHFPQLERPEAFVEAIEAFVGSSTRAKPGNAPPAASPSPRL